METKKGKKVTFEELVDLMLDASPEELELWYEKIDEEIAKREREENLGIKRS